MTAVDWFRLLWDLVQRGHTLAEVSRHTGISKGTLRGYLSHSQPPHWRGELLIAMWCDVCGKGRADLPVERLTLAPRIVVQRVGPQTSDDAVGELSRVVGGWR
jgi:lambda repressor-like predicted transcriptional regulator